MSCHREITDTDGHCLLAHRNSVLFQEKTGAVQRLGTITVRPPELRIFNIHGEVILFAAFLLLKSNFFSLRIIESALQNQFIVFFNQLILHLEGQSTVVTLNILSHVNGINPSALNFFYIYITPDSKIRQLWAPVPAKHAVRFPDMGKSRNRRIHAPDRFSLMLLSDIGKRRIKFDLNLVRSLVKKLCHIKTIGPMHVFTASHCLTVQNDFCQSIDSLTDKDIFVILKGLFRHFEASPVIVIKR